MINASADPLLAPFRFRSIGPASMGGRIDDIAVADSDPNIIYLGYAVGGVFKSENNGDDVGAGVRRADDGLDRRHRDSSGERQHRLRRHRRAEQPPDLVVRRRHLQDDRRRQDLAEHRPARNADHRPHRHRPQESGNGLRRSAGSPVRTQQGTRRLQDDRRRRELEPGQVHRRGHRVHRHRHRSGQHQHPLCRELSAATHGLLLQRRRTRQRAVEDHGRRQELDQADLRPAARHLRPHRARRLPLESQRRLRADRGRPDRPAADDRRQRSRRGNREHTGRRRGSAGRATRNHAIGRCRRSRRARRGGRYRPQGAVQRPRAAPEAVAASPTTGATTPVPAADSAAALSRPPATKPTPPPLDPVRGGIFRSENKGGSWTHVSNCNPRPMYFSQLRVDPEQRQGGLRCRACRWRSRSTAGARS